MTLIYLLSHLTRREGFLKKSITIVLLAAVSALAGTDLYCQPDILKTPRQANLIPRLDQPLNFDGIPDDIAWELISPFNLIVYSPVWGKEPSEESDVRMAYDDKYLYVGAWLYCKDPSIIRSTSYKRDYTGAGGDWFMIFLDTYNDKENFQVFATTPDALRYDATIQKDAVQNRPDDIPMNVSWNAFWDVLTHRCDEGWSAEFRIPLSSLRFQEKNGEVRMGLTIQRWIPARNEVNLFPAIPPNWGQLSPIKPSQAAEIIFHGIKSGKPVYVTPYILGGYSAEYDLNTSETDYYKTSGAFAEAGLDVKFGISDNLVMDLTINTDFAQVEADDEQINLSRYSLFFPEKRLFFLERASIFDFGLGGNNNLFYSRRIGLSDDGEPVRIYGGARIFGRLGKWDAGFLDMQTAPLWIKNSEGLREQILPSENFGVLRFRRQLINENSYIGTIFTSRLGVDGSYNIAYGLDGILRVTGENYLDIKWSQTFENDTVNTSIKEPLRFSANLENRSRKGFGYNIGYSYSGLHFNPGIGFEMLGDNASIRGGIRYGWISGERSRLYSHNPELRINQRSYADDGTLMSINVMGGWSFRTKNQWSGDLFLVYNIENLKEPLELREDELYVNEGRYEFINFRGNFISPMSKPLFFILTTETGQFFDGGRFSAGIKPTWNISKNYELGGTYNFDYVNFRSRGEEMTNHIIGVKALYMLNTKFSLNAYFQYNTAANGIISNIRLRYNPKEGNDLYIVVNEGRNTNLTRDVPNLPVYSSRSVMVKYTYTFNL
jgi:hypothetical protein